MPGLGGGGTAAPTAAAAISQTIWKGEMTDEVDVPLSQLEPGTDPWRYCWSCARE